MGLKLFKNQNLLNFDDFKDAISENVDCSLGAFSHSSKCEELFLNVFSVDEVYDLFDQVGLIKKLKSFGIANIIIDVDTDDENFNYLRVYVDKIHHNYLLIDLRLSDSKYSPEKSLKNQFPELTIMDVFVIEWISTRNPYDEFSDSKPQLPGQKYPGLGVLQYLIKILDEIGKKIMRDAFLNIPDHFHNALMYSKRFKFLDPVKEGKFQAVLSDLSKYSLAEVTWGFVTDSIVDNHSGNVLKYEPSEQILPFCDTLVNYFSSKKYKNIVKTTKKDMSLVLDYPHMETKKEELLKTKDIADL